VSDTSTSYKRDSSAASVSAGDVYRVGLLIKHAAKCECCRNAMTEDKDKEDNEAGNQPAPRQMQPHTTQPPKLGSEWYDG
jgi:hypothetical protein